MIDYYFDGKEIEYEPSGRDLFSVKKQILSQQDKKTLIELILDESDIEDIFYEEIKDCFEEKARENYYNTKQEKEDLMYDYYQDKL